MSETIALIIFVAVLTVLLVDYFRKRERSARSIYPLRS